MDYRPPARHARRPKTLPGRRSKRLLDRARQSERAGWPDREVA